MVQTVILACIADAKPGMGFQLGCQMCRSLATKYTSAAVIITVWQNQQPHKTVYLLMTLSALSSM